MGAQAEALYQRPDTSLTDVILTLCASGHCGVREAIAAATGQESRRSEADLSDASATETLTPETWRGRIGLHSLCLPATVSPKEAEYVDQHCSCTARGKGRPRNEDAVGLFPELQRTSLPMAWEEGRGASSPALSPSRPYARRCWTQTHRLTSSRAQLQPSQPLLHAVYRAHTQVKELSHSELGLSGMTPPSRPSLSTYPARPQ